MGRPKRDTKILNLSIETDIASELDEFAKITGVPMSHTVEKALLEYFQRHVTEEDGEKHYTV